jgi:uncharacterized protein (DUF305 family)
MNKKFVLCAMLALLPLAAMAADPAVKDVFADVNMKMHHAMMVKPTGNVDVDFVRGMIPHHQGAIDMAQIELQQGKDPEIRKLATGIIAAQKKEIAEMNSWLAKHGGAAPTKPSDDMSDMKDMK